MKFLLALSLLFFITTKVNAISGCSDGTFIYTTNIGSTNFWGTTYQVWSRSSAIKFYNNNDGKNSPPCGEVAPTGVVIDRSSTCWISNTVPPTNTSTGVTWGNNAVVTSSSYVPCPIDDGIAIIFIAIGIIGIYFIKRSPFITS